MTLLTRLLDEWRSTFDDALVEPIIALGEQLAKTRPPLPAKTGASLEEAWHARLAQGDPADLDLLLDARWPKNEQAVLRRLAALTNAPPDPRYPPKLLAVYGGHRHQVQISNVLKRSPTQQLEVLIGPNWRGLTVWSPNPAGTGRGSNAFSADPPPAGGAPKPRPPAQDPNFICFEPLAAIVNGLNLAHKGLYKELQHIAPGETWESSFWIKPSGF